MLGTLTQNQIEEVLQGQIIGRLGCYADGRVYIVPISYAYREGYLYVISRDGMKVQMMRKHPSVCFQVDRMLSMANWQSVVAWGEFEELTESEERKKALQILSERILPPSPSEMAMLSPCWPFQICNLDMIPGVVYRIRLTEKSGRFEKNSEEVYYAT